MKIGKFGLLALGFLAFAVLGFSAAINGTIKGRISPPEGGNRVWIISATDTLKTPIERGSFEVRDVKAGAYRIIIEANPPYKNVAKTGVILSDGQVLDLGEIALIQ